jgi:hypothetical protein
MRAKRKLIAFLALALMLATVWPVTAQGEEPPEEPLEEPEFEHPVVALLESYFEPQLGPEASERIATYHEEGMGLGVLVKLYAVAAEAAEACSSGEDEELCDVTVEGLVEAFRSGTGLGKLFKEYGKPAILGVGHVDKDNQPDHAGPKEKERGSSGPPEHAGPKAKERDGNGPPEHAGPKK